MQHIKIQINFNDNVININGSTPLIEFKKYIDKLKVEDAHMIQKNVRKQVNSYLKIFPKQEKIILDPPIITKDPEDKINWKNEALKWQKEAKYWQEKHHKLEKEFNEFKIEVKDLIIELKQEISQLREENKVIKTKLDYYDKKYNNEYDRVHNKRDIDKEVR